MPRLTRVLPLALLIMLLTGCLQRTSPLLTPQDETLPFATGLYNHFTIKDGAWVRDESSFRLHVVEGRYFLSERSAKDTKISEMITAPLGDGFWLLQTKYGTDYQLVVAKKSGSNIEIYLGLGAAVSTHLGGLENIRSKVGIGQPFKFETGDRDLDMAIIVDSFREHRDHFNLTEYYGPG